MNYNTVYVGMDVHKEIFSLFHSTAIQMRKADRISSVDVHYNKILNYLEAMCFHYGDDVRFIYSYETALVFSYTISLPAIT